MNAAEPRDENEQALVNAGVWAHGDFLKDYAWKDLRPAEVRLFELHGEQLTGRVLELGCGAGRVTGHLIEIARSVHGVDLSPVMVDYCRRNYPQATFTVGDLSDMSGVADGAYDVIVAPFCVVDVLGDAERRRLLREMHRVLVADGLLIFSTHNREYAPRISSPTRILARNPRRMLENVKHVPRRLRNRRRLLPLQREETDYAILVDEAHDFALLHYYIIRDDQARQLTELGFALLECLELNGDSVDPGGHAPQCPELHYAARRLETPA
jgi:SAM-dependent methyltransferase